MVSYSVVPKAEIERMVEKCIAKIRERFEAKVMKAIWILGNVLQPSYFKSNDRLESSLVKIVRQALVEPVRSNKLCVLRRHKYPVSFSSVTNG